MSNICPSRSLLHINTGQLYELVICCDKEFTVITDDESLPVPESIRRFIKKNGKKYSLARFIVPDDIELFRAKTECCSYLVASHFSLDAIIGGQATGFECRCIQYYCPSHSDTRTVRFAFARRQTAAMDTMRSCHELMEGLPAAAWEYDMTSDAIRYTPVSAPYEVFTLRGMKFVDSIEESLVLHPDFRAPFRKVRYAFISGVDDISQELKLLDTSGDYRWYSITGTVIPGDDGKPVGYRGQLRIADDSHVGSAVKTDDDPLTGLMNRHGMERSADKILSGGIHSAALLLLDIDDFNLITERLGKHFSDAMLADVGSIMRGVIAPTDLICRVSKDIFAILLTSPHSGEEASAKAEQLMQAIGHCYLNPERTENVTCCIGIAYDGCGIHTYEQLYYQADTALTYAKCRGKRSIEFFCDDLECKVSSDSFITSWTSSAIDSSDSQESSEKQPVDLLSQVVDVLFESRELSSSINIVLSLIGHRYGMKMAEILEFTDDYQNVYSTYCWNPDYNSITHPLKRSVADIEDAIMLGDGAEYFVCGNIDDIRSEHPNVASFCDHFGVTSFMNVPIRDGIKISGLIVFGVVNAVLRPEAVRELVLISKIISGYITRLQTKLDIDRLTTTDTLTGCFNLGRFITEVRHTLRENPQKQYVIIYSDIDRFKFINDTFGYLIGDKVLIEFSRIITESLRAGEVIGRIDADKFVHLVEYTDDDALLERLAACDVRVNSMNLLRSNYKIPVRCGICRIWSDDDISSVIDKANLARKSVKNTHVSTYTFFNEAMKSRIIQQKEIEDVMHDALRNGEFVVFLQPKFSLACNVITGAEALVRWDRPGYGLLKPDDFIPIFEENGFIIDLDFYVLENVCRKLRHDLDSHFMPYPISVNFSRVHLKTANFIERLHSCLDRYALPPNLIEVEITESALVGNEDYLVDMMSSLHELGLVVSMDDFGSGYSTLNLLKKFPVDVLKIDKEFFAGSGSSDRERCIIANVVNMAKSLNIRVVSEGVETVEQAEFLRGVNCDIAQGYLYARPMDMSSYELKYQSPGSKN